MTARFRLREEDLPFEILPMATLEPRRQTIRLSLSPPKPRLSSSSAHASTSCILICDAFAKLRALPDCQLKEVTSSSTDLSGSIILVGAHVNSVYVQSRRTRTPLGSDLLWSRRATSIGTSATHDPDFCTVASVAESCEETGDLIELSVKGNNKQAINNSS